MDRLEEVPGIPADIRMTGVRGMGKTVLLKRFLERAEANDWVTVLIELDARYAYEGEVVTRLTAACARKQETLSIALAARRRVGAIMGAAARAVAITYGDWSAKLDPRFGQPAIDLGRGIQELCETALESDKSGVVIAIDEAQFLADDADLGSFRFRFYLRLLWSFRLRRFQSRLYSAACPS